MARTKSGSGGFGRRATAAAALVLVLLGPGCASTRTYNRGQKEMRAQNFDRAVQHFSRAVAANPDSTRYKAALHRARMRAAQDHFSRGQAYVKALEWEAAVAEFQQVVFLDPSHQFAANELQKALLEWQKRQRGDVSEMEKMKAKAKAAPGREAPRLDPASNIPIVLRFKEETVKKIYEALSKASGINFIYDDKLDLNRKVSVDLADVTFEQALDTLMTMNKHFYKIWDENTILMAEDNAAKHKEYDDLVIQTFYLSNADVKDVQVLLRTLLDARQLAQNDRLNAITIRDTPSRVQVAQRIIEANDKSRSELIVDVELLEVNRTLLQNLGIDLIGSGGGSGKSVSVTYGGGTTVPLNNLDLLKQTGSYLLGPIPGVIINFLKSDADAQVLAKPQVRVSEGEKAQVKIGDKIPIPTTTFNAAPTVGGTVGVPITSFTYQNVGINIDMEPRVHHNREISIKLKVELSAIAGQVSAGGGLSQPIIGTREIDTTIRLKDAETNLLAGLIREEERRSMSGVPGLSDIPILKRLFGTTETNIQKTDIVLTLTPHIIRIPDITVEDLLPLWIGTESNIALRGASRQSAFGLTPFEGNGEEEAPLPLPGLPEPVVEHGAPLVAPPPGGGGGEGAPEAGQEIEEPAGPRAAPTPAESRRADDAPGGPPAGGTVTLEPALLTARVNQELTVRVAISGARGVGSVPFHVAFDPDHLEFTNFSTTSPFLSQDGAAVFVLATLGAGRREVIVGLSRQGSRPGVGGAGTLINLTFRAKQPGMTDLSFTDLSVLDPAARPLPVVYEGMQVSIQP